MTMTCAKCGGPMEIGFTLEMPKESPHMGGIRVSEWYAGLPERNFFGVIKLANRHKLPITTYRCITCGYLEQYANLPRKPKDR